MPKRSAQEVIASLPPVAYMVLADDPTLVIGVKPGVIGYFPGRRCTNEAEARELADSLNQEAGVTLAQRNAMEYGSCFGWDVPVADPETWEKRGHLK